MWMLISRRETQPAQRRVSARTDIFAVQLPSLPDKHVESLEKNPRTWSVLRDTLRLISLLDRTMVRQLFQESQHASLRRYPERGTGNGHLWQQPLIYKAPQKSTIQISRTRNRTNPNFRSTTSQVSSKKFSKSGKADRAISSKRKKNYDSHLNFNPTKNESHILQHHSKGKT